MRRAILYVLLADALVLPAGLITTVFLARVLGPEDYGVLTLAVSILLWVEWTLISLFSQLTVKYIAQAEDWKPRGSALLRLHLAAGLLTGFLLFLAAPLLASVLNEPRLQMPLRILAFDLPLFCLALLHRNVLAGVGRFGGRAAVTAARHLTKAILSLSLVLAGFSVEGAVLALLGASVAEFVLGRILIQPPLFDRTSAPLPGMLSYLAPLLIGGISIRLFTTLDLFALKALGAATIEAGHYGAAQGLANVPGFLSLVLSTVVVATVARKLHTHPLEDAADHALGALRFVVILLPFAALAAGSSGDLTSLVYGARYAPAALPMAFLIFAALARVLLQLSASLLTAAGRPRWNMLLMVPPLLLALIAYPLVIPGSGMIGAAAAHATIASAAALASLFLLPPEWTVRRLIPTGIRAISMAIVVFLVSRAWNTTGVMLLLEFVCLSLAIPAAYWLLGEFKQSDMRLFQGLLARRGSASRTDYKPER